MGIANAQYEPGVLIGKTPSEVKNIFKHFKDYNLIDNTDTTLMYYNWKEEYLTIYVFEERGTHFYCNMSSIVIDIMRGEELIALHLYEGDWSGLGDMTWLYYAPAYVCPLLVEMKYTSFDRMRFNYTIYRL